MIFNIYLTNLLRALSVALELADGDLSRHHWRTALIADRIAAYMALPQEQRRTLVYAALLHDIGAASRWEEKHSLYNHEHVINLFSHAERGYQLLKDSPHFKLLAVPILHHHDHWNGSSPSGLAGDNIPLASRIINIADSIEVLLADDVYILDQRELVIDTIAKLKGTQFDPSLVAVVEDLARQESFWLDLTNPHYYEKFFQDISLYGQIRLDIDDVIGIAEIFATIVDRTSQFTATHSRSVSEVAALLAEARGYSLAEVKVMRIAGLLHDLGKLTIPNSILEKPGKLTAREFSIIKQHTYYTYRILNQIDGFDIIAEWAAFHHETLDGKGYPFRISRENLRLGSRIVAVADVYTALTEHRPYRQLQDEEKTKAIMQDMVKANKIDGELVALLLSKRDALKDISMRVG
jgi:putative nucleotidyltransferase with HDIG domain